MTFLHRLALEKVENAIADAERRRAQLIRQDGSDRHSPTEMRELRQSIDDELGAALASVEAQIKAEELAIRRDQAQLAVAPIWRLTGEDASRASAMRSLVEDVVSDTETDAMLETVDGWLATREAVLLTLFDYVAGSWIDERATAVTTANVSQADRRRYAALSGVRARVSPALTPADYAERR